jgi:hypothetical protein
MGLERERKGLVEKYIEAVSENNIYYELLEEYWRENGSKLDLPGSARETSGFRGELWDSNDDQPHGKLRKMIRFVLESRIISRGS